MSDAELTGLTQTHPPTSESTMPVCLECGLPYRPWMGFAGPSSFCTIECLEVFRGHPLSTDDRHRLAALNPPPPPTVADLPIGANKAAERLAERLHRTITSRDVKALVKRGLLTAAGEYNGWPTYAPAALDAITADQVTAVAEARTDRRTGRKSNPSGPTPAQTEIKDGSDGSDGTYGSNVVDDGSPIDGDDLLDRVAEWVGQYLALPSTHCLTVITLWAAHTHAADAFYVTPRLILDSAEPGSGKTRVLELLNLLACSPIYTMNTSIAALYRRLVTTQRTILFDETDAVFAKGAAGNHEDLRALLNAGYKRGATVDRCVIKASEVEVVEFPAFAPAALAGIAGNMPATITDRAITISMRRRAPHEDIAEFIEEDAATEAQPLQADLAVWMRRAVSGGLRAARPVMPDGVRDRKAEIWRALLAVANAAGGQWPEMAQAACSYFALGADTKDVSLSVRLLLDISGIWEQMSHVTFLSTHVLLGELKKIEDSPWGAFDMSARKLALRLKRFDIEPRHNDQKTERGYHREDFKDAFSRYVPSEPSKPSLISVPAGQGSDGSGQQPVQTSVPDGLDGLDGLFTGTGEPWTS